MAIARCRRYGAPLSLLLVDVDRLKLVNDRWGHHAGDQALARVSAAIQKSLRGTDIAARLGGDEFAIILPDTDAVAGLIVATRIRRNLVESASMMVTVSGGLVELPRHAMQVSAAQLMLVADHALYAPPLLAKRTEHRPVECDCGRRGTGEIGAAAGLLIGQ